MMDADDARARLLEWYPKGSTVFTVLRHVSASKMSRVIGLVAVMPFKQGERPDIRHPNHAAAALLPHYKRDPNRDGLKVSGCGMDMGFAVAYDLSMTLYGDGYALSHAWL